MTITLAFLFLALGFAISRAVPPSGPVAAKYEAPSEAEFEREARRLGLK